MREPRSCYFELVSGKDNILLYQKLENFAMGYLNLTDLTYHLSF